MAKTVAILLMVHTNDDSAQAGMLAEEVVGYANTGIHTDINCANAYPSFNSVDAAEVQPSTKEEVTYTITNILGQSS